MLANDIKAANKRAAQANMLRQNQVNKALAQNKKTAIKTYRRR